MLRTKSACQKTRQKRGYIYIRTHQRLTTCNFCSTATKEKSRAKVKNKISLRRIMIALALFTLPAVTEGHSDRVVQLQIRRNQSVTLSAGAKDGDTGGWVMSPAGDDVKYFSICGSYENSKERHLETCGGYQCRRDHSIFIENVKPCHAGTYTFTNADEGDPVTIILSVDDTAEVTTGISNETNVVSNVSGTEFGLSSTQATNKPSDQVTTFTLAVISSIAIAVIVVVIIIIILCLKGKCTKIWNKLHTDGINDNVKYSSARTEEENAVEEA